MIFLFDVLKLEEEAVLSFCSGQGNHYSNMALSTRHNLIYERATTSKAHVKCLN